MQRQRALGFTLVEVLIVVAIIALLAAITVPLYMNMNKTYKRQTCMNNLRSMGVALEQYRQDYGAYPDAPLPAYLQSVASEVGLSPLPPSESPGPSSAYMPFSERPGVGRAAFLGSGLDDMTSGGSFTGTSTTDYLVEIDSVGVLPAADTFRWSDDDGATWQASLAPITGGAQPLNNGVTVAFASANGHTVGDAWSFVAGQLPAGWSDWARGSAKLSVAAVSGVLSVSLDDASDIIPGMRGELREKDGAYSETVTVFSVAGTTVTLASALTQAYQAGSTLDMGLYRYVPVTNPQQVRVGNFGLARLYYLYLQDKKDYIGTRERFHCPLLFSTEDVDRGENVSSFHSFDPLWAGYNNYDMTYNYDQFYNDILAFDTALGHGDLNSSRQLKNSIPPADTVVCWCFGERADQMLRYPDPTAPGLTVPEPASPDERAAVADLVRRSEHSLRRHQVLVLWADGTVAMMWPTLMAGKPSSGQVSYYWVPPFLCTPGDWRK